MQVDWPINVMLSNLGLLLTGLHKQTVVKSKWSFGQVPLYILLDSLPYHAWQQDAVE